MVALPAESIKRPALLQRQFLGIGALLTLFAVAVLVRLVGITLFVTPDEDNWMRRTGNFAHGLQTGELWQTYQAGHPGVTTMWIARFGYGFGYCAKAEVERTAKAKTASRSFTRGLRSAKIGAGWIAGARL